MSLPATLELEVVNVNGAAALAGPSAAAYSIYAQSPIAGEENIAGQPSTLTVGRGTCPLIAGGGERGRPGECARE